MAPRASLKLDVYTGGTDRRGSSGEGAASVRAGIIANTKAQVVWQVFEEGSSRRLRDVSVRVYSGELEIASATTGEDGRVEMALEAFDSLQVVVESDGYLALVSSFEAAAQASLAFDIMLLPESAFGGIGKLYEANVSAQAPALF